jgi:uncharacterized protein (TIGR03437 family)
MKYAAFVVAVFFSPQVFAVEWDTSGNGLLNGTYNFREVLWICDLDATNTLDEAASQYGTITFDGQGNYTIDGSAWSSLTNSVQPYAVSGRYAIAASGFGFIRRPRPDGFDISGSVANGVFIGSSTESPTNTQPGFNTLFIAARRPATNVTTASFTQPYTLAYTNLFTPNLATKPNLGQIRDASFQIAPNGAAFLGAIQATGYSGGNSAVVTQTINDASYTFANGIGTLNFGTTDTTLISGTKLLYVASGGEFVFGGSANGWDMFVGVRRTTTPVSTAFDKVYYQGGIEVRRTALPSGTASLDSYFGTFNVVRSIGQILGHQRLLVAPDYPYEFTYSDTYNLSAGVHDDFVGMRHFVSDNGNFRVGFGRGSYLGINAAVKAPAFSGPGVFIDPTGVVNAASYSPFTTGISPGEVIAIFGTGLASGTFSDGTLPFTLGNASVRINGRPAPLYYASPGLLSVLVPFETEVGGAAEIQVTNNGVTSNRITTYVNLTSPGVFSQASNGLGYAAAQHADYSLITPQHPAQPGEIIMVYFSGGGATTPAIATGAAGPINPLAETSSVITAKLDLVSAPVDYSGLVPTAKGLYQLNVKIPDNALSGDLYLDVEGPDAVNSQIQIPVAGNNRAAAAQTRERPTARRTQAGSRTRRSLDDSGSSDTSSRSR